MSYHYALMVPTFSCPGALPSHRADLSGRVLALESSQQPEELAPLTHHAGRTTMSHVHFDLALVHGLIETTDVPNHIKLGTASCIHTTKGVLHSNSLVGGDLECLQSELVDSRVRLRGWDRETGRSGEDVAVLEILAHIDRIEAAEHAWQRRRGDDGEVVLAVFDELVQDWHNSNARLSGFLDGSNDGILLPLLPESSLFVGDGEAMLLAKLGEHVLEGTTEPVRNEFGGSVSLGDTLRSEDAVGDWGGSLKRKVLGVDEGVVQIEEDPCLGLEDNLVLLWSHRKSNIL